MLEFQDTAGFTPLLIAASRVFSQVARLVSYTSYGLFLILKSTRAPYVRASDISTFTTAEALPLLPCPFTQLLAGGASVDYMNTMQASSGTALHEAITNSHSEMVKLLLLRE